MKILHVIPSLWRGGAERVLLDLAEQQVAHGHTVEIVVLRDDNRFLTFSTSISINVTQATTSYSILGNQSNTEEFDEFIKEFRPDVIHSHLIEAELVSRNNPVTGVAYITHWHGCPELTNPVSTQDKFSRKFLFNWITKQKLLSNYKKCNNHFLCISEFIGNYVQENLHVTTNSVSVIHNAVDLKRFRPLPLDKKSGFRLISIGSLQNNKNHRFLFKLVRKLLDEGLTDIYLDVYGDGPERECLASLIVELNLSEHVFLHGLVGDPEAQLNRSHALVHSAWHEPFGLIFIEAMACGTPVISFGTGGAVELIEHETNGLLVPKDDLEEFAKQVKRIYENRDLIDFLGKNGISHAQKFNITDYAQKVEQLYSKRLAVVRK